MSLRYRLEQYVLNIIDSVRFRRCKNCDEIILDDYCDYCRGL